MLLLVVRILCLISIVFMTYSGLWWLLIPAAAAYFVRFKGYEVLVLAFCLDVYFMTNTFTPLYTSGAVFLFVAVTLLRPSFRNESTV
jgi:hypothetical protein